MIRMFRTSLAGIVAVAAVAGCGGRGLPAPDTIARVEGEDVSYADFERYLQENSLASEATLSSEVLSRLLDQFLDETLTLRLAVERSPDAGAESPQRKLESMLDEAARQEITDAKIAEYFAVNRDLFGREETVVLEQILVDTRAAAESALEAVESGMSFEDAARELSRGPGAGLGGLQGELGRADLPPALADVIFGLDEGEVSEIVAADYGFHLFRVVEKSPAESPRFEDARPMIVKRLTSETRGRALERLVEEARRSYNVVVYARNLPFNYAGSYR